MLTRFLIAAVIALAACRPSGQPRSENEQTPTPAPTLPPISTPEPEVTDSVVEPTWLETEMNGVSLGMWQPDGWESDQSHGLVLAEQTVDNGMLIYCFVPLVDELSVHADGEMNFALAVVRKVVRMPIHTGRDVAVSEPIGFEWDHHQAAYYLLSTGGGMRTLVLVLALSGEQKVVVCNLSVPSVEANRIRTITPLILDGLTVDGETLDSEGLDSLPDPLPFPRYTLASRPVHEPVASTIPTSAP